jgi:hypothetical protein
MQEGSSLFSVVWRRPKHQAPSSKSQAPNQSTSNVVVIQGGVLGFGAWNFSGAWSMGFEASQPGHSTENSEEPTGVL